jgi:hypothetical protein
MRLARKRCATCRPKASGHLPPEGDRSARSSRRTVRRWRVAPHLRTLRQVSVSHVTRRWPWARSDPTPARFPVTVADSSSLPCSRKSPAARSEVAVNTVRVPTPLSPPERCGLGRSPLLTAPACVRSPERASVNTPENSWSRGIFKFTGLSPELSRYPQVSRRRPLVAHRSCTAMCTAPRLVVAPAIASEGRTRFNGAR